MDPALFAEMVGDPTDENVLSGGEAFRSHSADAVIALGGGSGLDAGKSIAITAKSGLTLQQCDYFATETISVDQALMPPVVALPTTAGTGAEMDAASVLTVVARREKMTITHPQLSLSVIADPALTLSLPPHLTAWTGFDALVHAIEAYSVDSYHPMCDAVALEALRLIDEFLPRAVADGSDIVARSQMLSASALAAVAFQKGLGSVHALAESVGAMHHTHHGLTNAVVLPHVLRANAARCPGLEAKFARLVHYLRLPPAGNGSALDATLAWIERMRVTLGVAGSLAEIGIGADSAVACGERAVRNGNGLFNPVTLSQAEYEAIFHAALEPPQQLSAATA